MVHPAINADELQPQKIHPSSIQARKRWQWWKQEFARGTAKHGQDFVETQATVIVSSGTGKVPHMEFVMRNSQDLHASVTLNVDPSIKHYISLDQRDYVTATTVYFVD